MARVYFKELQRYTYTELDIIFKVDPCKLKKMIRKLSSVGILKIINNVNVCQDSLENSIIDIDDDQKIKAVLYFFDYIGIVIFDDIAIKCYPKYITDSDKEEALKMIMPVLRKYNEKEQLVQSMSGLEENSDFNILSVALFILFDFMENGIYRTQKDIAILNGEGEIDWDKTINNTHAILNNNKPVYLDYYTNSSVDDDSDYYKKLHMNVLTRCSDFLNRNGLNEIFSLPEIVFDTDEDLLIDKEFALYKIIQELNRQFITRKQLVLKSLYAFISRENVSSAKYKLSFYGTKNFKDVWEKVCAFVLDDQLHTSLVNLNVNLKKDVIIKDIPNPKLKHLIEKPLWVPIDNGGAKFKSRGSLQPDIISLYGENDDRTFIVSDAKYYDIKLNINGIKNTPGVGDITKQYLYSLAYKKFINEQGFKNSHNVFIFPSEKNYFELLGHVKMDLLKALNLDNIKVIKAPAQEFFDNYINNKKLNITKYIDLINSQNNYTKGK